MDFFVWQRTCVDDAGNVLAAASVTVTDVVSGELAQLYSDPAGSVGIGNPITADSEGFVQFYVKAGFYNITATSGASSRTWTREAIGAPHPRTAAEISAGVTPVDYRYMAQPIYDVRRLGGHWNGEDDDSDVIQAAVDALGDHGTIILPPLARIEREIVMPSDKNVRILGSPTRIVIGNNVGFGIYDVPSNDTARHIFDGLSWEAVNDYEGNPFYLENAGGQTFRNMKFFYLHTYFDIHNKKSGDFSEGNQFDNIEGKGYIYGWRYRKTDGNGSCSDQHFIRCKISQDATNDPATATYGLYVGTGMSLYRSFFGNLTIFPEVENSIGVYVDGDLRNATGAINIEGDTGKSTTGFYFDANAANGQCNIYADIRSVDTKIHMDPAITTDITIRSASFGVNNAIAAGPDSAVVIGGIFRTDDEAKIYERVVLTNDRVVHRFTQPMEFRDLASDRAGSIKAFPFGDSLTETADPTPDVNAVKVLNLQYGSATDVTGFTGGMTQQILVVRHLNANATLKHSATLRLQGATDYTGVEHAIHMFYHVGNDSWQEISRITPS